MPFSKYLTDFMHRIRKGEVEVYNEISLQVELGIYLRENFPEYKVQFERNVSYFGIDKHHVVKREIDIVISNEAAGERYAIELKNPREGQHPIQMFKAAQDIRFLEQLTDKGFRKGYFIMLVHDPLFYESGRKTGIYRFFRGGEVLSGTIEKPTGKPEPPVTLEKSHSILWSDLGGADRYAVVTVG